MSLAKKRPLFVLPLFVSGLFLSPAVNPVDPELVSSKTTIGGEGVIRVQGLVTVDANPCAAEVEIVSTQRPRAFHRSTQTDTSGIFNAELPTGDEFEFVIRTGKFPQQVMFINTDGVQSDSILNVYADFVSPEYDKKLIELKRSIAEEMAKRPKKFSEVLFAKNYGDMEREGLGFQVQVGAYKFFENFNYNAVIGMPKIIRKIGGDGITRFTMGNFKTYNEAHDFLKKIKKDQLREAFVVAFYKEESKLLRQLEEENILPP